MKMLKQLLQDHDRKLYNTPICGSPLYQERDVLEAVKEWLTQKRQEKRTFSGNPHWSYYDELLEELNQ